MTDIESNLLYKTILDDFRQQFDVACRQSYVIALPVNQALQNVTIDQVLVNSHILMPSKLLKMHYTPLQVGHAADDIEIDGKQLIIHPSGRRQPAGFNSSNNNKVTIKILAEETGYNSENKQYRLLLIDRPLISTASTARDHNSNTEITIHRQKGLLLSLFGPKKDRATMHVEPPELLLDHNDCSRYLESISQQLTVELESEVQRIQSKYIILSHYLQDAAERIAQLTETFIPRYIDQHGGPEPVRVSVENYTIHLLHGKLIASIYHRYEKNDALFDQNLELVRQSHASVCELGAQAPFKDLEIGDKIKTQLRSMVSLQSPLAMVNVIVKLVDGISSSLDDCVRANQLTMDGEVLESISICSDDLIASLIFALAQARPSRIYSMAKYLELFNWSARDRAAYYTATFHVVVQYIYNYSSNLLK